MTVDRTPSLIRLAADMREQGRDIDFVLVRLRDEGATIIECVKVVRAVEGVPLKQAKDIVDRSEAWADAFEANSALRNTVADAVDDERKGPGGIA